MVHLDCNGGHGGIECDSGRRVEEAFDQEQGESVWMFSNT